MIVPIDIHIEMSPQFFVNKGQGQNMTIFYPLKKPIS